MYNCNFNHDMENMVTSLHNSGLQLQYLNYFLTDFDKYCKNEFPEADVLTFDIVEKWIHNTTSESNAHMSRRVRTMKHLGEYQLSIGKPAYIPTYAIHYKHTEEPHLFSDEQLKQFFLAVDTKTTATTVFPNNDVILPVMFRMMYSCGLRASEACNLKMEDVDFERGTLTIYRSKGFKDRILFMSDDLKDLCQRFNALYSKVIPN